MKIKATFLCIIPTQSCSHIYLLHFWRSGTGTYFISSQNICTRNTHFGSLRGLLDVTLRRWTN
jgi:hypothetical protein